MRAVAGFLATNTSLPCPIILTFQNNCSIVQRGVMVDMLHEIFGDKLYVPPTAAIETWPSPFSLRGKIVVRGKLVFKQDKQNYAQTGGASLEMATWEKKNARAMRHTSNGTEVCVRVFIFIARARARACVCVCVCVWGAAAATARPPVLVPTYDRIKPLHNCTCVTLVCIFPFLCLGPLLVHCLLA